MLEVREFILRGVRYLLAGGGLVVVDYAVFFALHSGAGMDLGMSQAAARLTGAVAGFVLQKIYVFRAHPGSVGERVRQGMLYSLLTAANILLSGLFARFLDSGLGLRPTLAVKLATDIVFAGETFLLLHLVFRRRIER